MNDEEKTLIRSAWMDPGTKSAKDQHNEGGQAFLFPGKVPGLKMFLRTWTASTPPTSITSTRRSTI